MAETKGFSGSELAIIGMAGRFPGAGTLEEYWRNLRDGVESVRFFTDAELRAAGERPDLLDAPGYVKAQPVLDDVDRFDAGFFGMSARDAALMDPQHRLFLEVTWEALEHAGYVPDAVPGVVGVFAAAGMNAYMMHNLMPNAEIMETVGEWLVRHTGNDMNFLATRVSYQLNLTGPSMNVQTACSSALVALHLACQHLLSGECDVALAGASTVVLPQGRGYVFQPGEILTLDGHCRPFDAHASGTIFGSGAGCVVLRRLSDALAAGDPILAIVRGSAVNNDGADRVSYLAPGVEGQSRAVAEALAIAGVNARSISYVEAHGTGTPVGDPIEVTALTRAFRADTTDRGFCTLGSVKANIGHLGEAAGMAGVIKTVLALQHRELPPSINYTAPNPDLGLADSPFVVSTTRRPWVAEGPRRAGVTALGAGGTNAHLVLEEAPTPAPATPDARAQLLVLSARSVAAVERAAERLADHLERHPEVALADAAWVLQTGRKRFPHRWSVVARDRPAAIAALRAGPSGAATSATLAASRAQPSVVFAFPGGGAQYPGMGRELYEREPTYRQAFDACLDVIAPALADRVRALVLGPDADLPDAAAALEAPSVALPALFATEYATARLLIASGLEPAALVGHSMGEYVAACLAGVFTLADALSLVAVRGRLFETLPPGGMLSVNLPEDELRALLGSEMSIAAVNAPALCVASGPVAALDALQQALAARGVDAKRIPITVAAHSAMLEPILAEFRVACRRLRLQAPTIPIASNVTGTLLTAVEATDPEYWVRHLRHTVRFADGVASLVAQEPRVFVEVGPGRTLSSLARQHSSAPASFPTLRHASERASDVEFLLAAVGRVWQGGARVDLARRHDGARRTRVALPTYPFERDRHWVDAPAAGAPRRRGTGPVPKTGELSDWFYAPAWRRSATPAAAPDDGGTWLVFAGDAGLAERLAGHCGARPTVLVYPGERYARTGDDSWTIRAGAGDDYKTLLEALAEDGRDPAHVVHLWGVTAPVTGLAARLRRPDDLEELAASEGFCFHSLLHLAQALAQREVARTLTIVTTGMHRVDGADETDPAKALAVGPLRVIPREMPYVRTRGVDVALGAGRPADVDAVARRLMRELEAPVDETVVALRGVERWVQRMEPLRLDAEAGRAPAFRPGSTVLITGGLGGIGLELALHLARTARVRLVLVGRSTVPPRDEWPALISEFGSDDPLSARLTGLLAIESAGAECYPIAGDVTDVESMEAVVRAARRRFGAVHAVVHAAGVLDDAPIAVKSASRASAVIGPKARGALVLERVLRDEPLETFVVFSSVGALLGLEGQVDYTAANAFLDAFAERLQARGRVRAVSIAWNAWQEVGMAAALTARTAVDAPRVDVTALQMTGTAPGDDRTVTTTFSVREHWLLSEHVVRGAESVLPGTAYLAMARASAARALGVVDGTVELRDVTFLSPFAVRRGERRALHLRLADDRDGGVRFAFESEAHGEPHVVGRAARVTTTPGERVRLDEIAARCPRHQQVGGRLDQPFVEFGPRWANIEQVYWGDGEALLSLALPDAYVGDLAEYHPHPALMDMATGGAQALIPGFDQATDFFVPLAYGRVTVHRPLPQRVWSHVRHRTAGSRELASFDVTLYDAAGEVLVEVADFRMKRIADARVMAGKPVAQAATTMAGDGRRRASGARTASGDLSGVVRNGIAPAEGMEAFDRILSRELGGHLVASSVDVNEWRARLDAPARGSAGDGSGGETAGARPSFETSYVAPRNSVEEVLASVWAELLGLQQVGVHDDFFDLGGQSLVAVRMFTRICRHFGVDLPLSSLFDAPTIAKLAALVAGEAGLSLDDLPIADASATGRSASGGDASIAATAAPAPHPRPKMVKKAQWRTLVPMQREGTESPFYVAAGMGGTLNNLRSLALHLGDARPVYGLQPPGADDRSEILYSVEELAARYIREVREVQPHGPYFLGGYSGGGVAAYEMARQLTAAGEEVAFLGFLDSFSPALPRRAWGQRAVIHLGRVREQGVGYLLRTLRRRYEYQRGALMLRAGHALGAIFPRRYRYESIQESWLVAEANYRPQVWSGRGTLFRARTESAVSLWTAFEVDEAHGWGRYLSRGVRVEVCPGNHQTMCEMPNVRVLAAKLRAAIDEAGREVATDSGEEAPPFVAPDSAYDARELRAPAMT